MIRPPVTIDELWIVAENALKREVALQHKVNRLMERLEQLLPIEAAVLDWLEAQDDPDDYGYLTPTTSSKQRLGIWPRRRGRSKSHEGLRHRPKNL